MRALGPLGLCSSRQTCNRSSGELEQFVPWRNEAKAQARGFYARAGALKDELRVTELLGDWQAGDGGRLGRREGSCPLSL